MVFSTEDLALIKVRRQEKRGGNAIDE